MEEGGSVQFSQLNRPSAPHASLTPPAFVAAPDCLRCAKAPHRKAGDRLLASLPAVVPAFALLRPDLFLVVAGHPVLAINPAPGAGCYSSGMMMRASIPTCWSR
jgi:hypothetical protein